MHRTTGFIAAVFFVFASVSRLNAGVLVNSIFNLTQLQLSASAGTVTFMPPSTAQAFAMAQDSLGGSSSPFDSETTTPATAAALTLLAAANAGADPSAYTASASSSIDIPGDLSDSAFSTGQGTLLLTFHLSAPADLTLSATLSGSQSLQAAPSGILATSEIVFNLRLPDVSSSPELFYDHLVNIGSNQSSSTPYSATLTNKVTSLSAGNYSLIAQVDSESSGLNAPEPGYTLPAMAVFAWICLRRRAVR